MSGTVASVELQGRALGIGGVVNGYGFMIPGIYSFYYVFGSIGFLATMRLVWICSLISWYIATLGIVVYKRR